MRGLFSFAPTRWRARNSRRCELRPVTRASAAITPEVAGAPCATASSVFYFLDDRAYPEPSGFWVAGERETALAIQPDVPRPVSLLLRNGAADNTVTIEVADPAGCGHEGRRGTPD